MSYSIKNFLEDQYKDELSFLKKVALKLKLKMGIFVGVYLIPILLKKLISTMTSGMLLKERKLN
jgi:hypothetical protein